ncbi:MAG TPA: SulP family inorganic anion transporter [Myxococcota bacterium]|nr:SulP family inorganic anion transporter [Myxococcota bacterium]
MATAAPSAARVQRRLEPKLWITLREGISARQLAHDALAGVIVGIVALPLAIAFGIASGVKPEQGLYTAIVGGFIISAFGGSRVQIGGPTGAFVVIVSQIVAKYGYDGLAVATLMAGVLLVAMGFARLGAAIKFVPYPVTIGFTTGIALIIARTQLRDFAGASASAAWSPWALALGVFTVVLLVLWPRVNSRIPGPLVAIVACTLAASLFHLPVETIGDRFGAVPTHLPRLSVPDVDLARLRELVSPAIAIALLAAIESLLSAMVADGMIGTRHRSDMELVAQGLANLASPLFGGIPVTGAIARTATNVKNGGRTPVAGIVHAATLLAIVLAFGHLAEHIPICALAGILLVVAYNMSEWRMFVRLFRSPRSDVLVLLVTFSLTVFVDLTMALQAGVVLASFLFMARVANLSQAGFITHMLREGEDPADPGAIARRHVPDGVEVFEVYGSFFFGAASKFRDAIREIERKPRVLVVRLREVLAIDATGLRALEDLFDKTNRDGTALVLSGIHAQPLQVLERSGLLERIGLANVFVDVDAALARASELLRGE